MPSARRAEIWPYALFVLSGAAALVLETVFLRQLVWILGSSARALSLVLAAFMAGLALGSALLGRAADASSRPLRLFGLLELGTAVSGAGLAWLFGAGRGELLGPLAAVEAPVLRDAAGFGAVFLLLLVPTTLMGGTLPALSRHVIRDPRGFTGSLGLLYGVNTLGAAAGVLATGFVLFESVGVSASAWIATSMQAVVGIVAVGIGIGDSNRISDPSSAKVGKLDGNTVAVPAFPILLAAGGGGLCVLGYEVVWTRLLSLPLRSFSYSFSLMLGLFLLGLCAGALLLAALGRSIARPLRWVGWLQIAIGAHVAASLFWLPPLLVPATAASFEEFLARSAAKAALIVLPPTILSGMALPLAARAWAAGCARVGAPVGLIYGVNTAGAILGALGAGLAMLPALGAPRSLALLGFLQAAIGAVVLAGASRPIPERLAGAAAALACALALVALDPGRFAAAFLAASRGAEEIGGLLFLHEGATDTVAVVRKEYGFLDPRAKSLITNGVAMSATVKPVWRYMAAEGHLPALLARSPRRALAIGVGTGITLGALAAHPALESIVAVELSEGVIRALPHFAEENRRAWQDPRVRLVREDGRHWLETSRESFDVITVEPPPPIVAGSAHLYSRDFYDACLARLSDGGVVAQWLPLHAQSLASARMTARTFLDAFPHVTLWLPSVRDAILIGTREPQRLDPDRLASAWARAETRADLVRAYLETPEALLGTLLLDRAGIERFAAGAPPVTDERPRMEFFRRQGGNMEDRDVAALLAVPQAGWSWIDGLDAQPDLLARVERENRALRLYVRAAVEGDRRPHLEAARLARGTEFFRYAFGCASDQLERLGAGTDPRVRDAAAHAAACARMLGAPAS